MPIQDAVIRKPGRGEGYLRPVLFKRGSMMNNEECLQKLKLLNSMMQDLFDNMDLDEADAEVTKAKKADKKEDK